MKKRIIAYQTLVLLMFFIMFTCTSKTSKTKINETVEEQDEISEVSIYQLTSNWKTQDNEIIKFKDLKDHVLVVVMMFTSCRVSCPTLVSDIKRIEKKVTIDKHENIKYVLISIDSKIDTPEVLKQFSIDNELTGNQWLLLNGTEENIREFANVVAVSYKQISPIEFSHSNIISVFNPSGELTYQEKGFGNSTDEIVNEIIKL